MCQTTETPKGYTEGNDGIQRFWRVKAGSLTQRSGEERQSKSRPRTGGQDELWPAANEGS